ncbi:MAG: hypothetical protein AABX82_06660 [Nanoarchaeota archaeon]
MDQTLYEGFHMFQRRIHVAINGIPKYKGDSETICKHIIQNCWNGSFFQVSTGHFSLFYIRDFGMCIDALLRLGYQKEAQKTLQFALTVYSRENRITTTISRNGIGFDVFSYAPDSLAFLLYSLRVSKNKELVEMYKPFLELQISHFYNTVVDEKTGLVQSGRNFSSIKDHAKRSVSCYDSCCIAVVAREATMLGLKNPFVNTYSYKKIQEKIKETFWTGDYFSDCEASDIITGDANVFPYWFRIFTDRKMIIKSIAAIQKQKLDQPLPLKYTSFIPKNFFFPLELVAPNYEGNSIWAHLGLCYIDVVASVDKKLARKYVQEYKKQIEKHKNFLELYNPEGQPYKSLFYYSDAGMLWCSKWFVLKTL